MKRKSVKQVKLSLPPHVLGGGNGFPPPPKIFAGAGSEACGNDNSLQKRRISRLVVHSTVPPNRSIPAKPVRFTFCFVLILAVFFTAGGQSLLASEHHAAPAHVEETGHGETHEAGAREAQGGEKGEHEGGGLHLPNFITVLYHFYGKDIGIIGLLHKQENIFFSYIVIFMLITVVYLTYRKLRKIPTGFQGLLELYVSGFNGLSKSVIGEKYGPGFTAYIGTVFIYILCLNFMGLIPLMKSSIAFNPNMPLSLALCTVVLVQYHGIKQNGLKNYLMHFVGEPIWLAPLNILLHGLGEFIIKPTSLTLRLTMNITAEDAVIGGLIVIVATSLPVFLPIPVHAFFFPLALLFSLIQAFVFTILSTIYLSLMTPHEEH